MNDDQKIAALFEPLYGDIAADEQFNIKKPLLAHYTSISTLEAILRNEGIWFSNPLFMNDMEEVRFGINEGFNQFIVSDEIEKACESRERFEKLKYAITHFYNVFANDHVVDTYVFCLSEHQRGNQDGLLSMWRGYGGNGNGVGIVFDAGKLNALDGSPLIVAKVDYATQEKRLGWLTDRMSQFAEILKLSKIADSQLHVAAFAYFQRIKLFALFSKHNGFDEEREWRVVYMRDRDNNKSLDSMFGYSIGQRGVEPKLKFKISPMAGVAHDGLSLSNLIHQIILGPSISSPLAKATMMKMLDHLKKPELKDRIIASTIPFRAT
jgi:DUF2971 family protein